MHDRVPGSLASLLASARAALGSITAPAWRRHCAIIAQSLYHHTASPLPMLCWVPSLCLHCPIIASSLQYHCAIMLPSLPTYAQAVLGPIIEHVREVDKAASELSGMVRTLSNAYNLYLRTRPAASSESVKRARQLPQEGVHPTMLAALPPALHGDVTNESALAQ
eukprot:scaffold44929_cov24-Tisochrysis_lutea.AAC.2